MTTVYTKEELQKAIKRKEFPISCRGEIAEQLKKRKKRSKAAKLGGAAVVIAGLAALPFTGGASAGAAAMGLTATAAATVGIGYSCRRRCCYLRNFKGSQSPSGKGRLCDCRINIGKHIITITDQWQKN